MTDFIGIDISGDKELIEKLNKLPQAAKDAGVESVNQYLLDYERTNQPPYSYVSVKRAGGWKSEKQRRYVMAKIRSGDITVPYRRTQNLRKGWKVIGKGEKQIVVNEVSYAGWVKDIQTQSKMMFLRKWTVIQEDVQKRMPEILKKFSAGVQKAIKKVGL